VNLEIVSDVEELVEDENSERRNGGGDGIAGGALQDSRKGHCLCWGHPILASSHE
jgi:hypothetical protein